MAAEKVARTGVLKEPGWLYFVDRLGNVSRVEARKGSGRQQGDRRQTIARPEVDKVEGWLYFVDKDGDVARVPAKKGSKRRRGSYRKRGV